LFGLVAGYAIKKVMKIAVLVIGLFVVGLTYLSYRGWVDVKWAAMEDASSTLTNASEQVVDAFNNTAAQFVSHPSAVAASGLPIAATFHIGALLNYERCNLVDNVHYVMPSDHIRERPLTPIVTQA
jgi:uncharacterized membrane protein (Fun14 family)